MAQTHLMPYLYTREKKTMLALRKCVYYIYIWYVTGNGPCILNPTCAACILRVLFSQISHLHCPVLITGFVCRKRLATIRNARLLHHPVESSSSMSHESCHGILLGGTSLSVSHPRSLVLSWSPPLLRSLSLARSLSVSLALSLSRSLSLTHTHTLSRSLSRALSFSLSYSLANTHIHQVYKAHNVSSTLRVYFLSYTESVEEQRYLSEVRRETGENSRKSARESICNIK